MTGFRLTLRSLTVPVLGNMILDSSEQHLASYLSYRLHYVHVLVTVSHQEYPFDSLYALMSSYSYRAISVNIIVCLLMSNYISGCTIIRFKRTI